MSETFPFSMGYLAELADIRDYSLKDLNENELPRNLDVTSYDLPKYVDNRNYCSTVEDQGPLGTCCAHGGTSLFEYIMKKTTGTFVQGSRLFVYYNSRKYAGLDTNIDSGTFVRSTVKAIVLSGICEESLWKYDIKKFKEQPSEFLYSNAQQFRGTKYLRLDDGKGDTVLKMKNMINSGYGLVVGFPVYDSIQDVTKRQPVLPFPSRREKLQGGHCVMICGYDSDAPSRNYRDNNETKGAFLALNSWSSRFADEGFFWIPEKFVTEGLMMDIWTVTNGTWIDTGAFD
ncbi:MAG: C1 family peptidase [Candidatus Nitrosocosmicus sp.]|nr:C1 family peptidase [Candidatus Nitrosocosmicus sp.]